jgi:hypothetical protein
MKYASPPSMINRNGNWLDDWITRPITRAHYELTEDGVLQCIADNKNRGLVYRAVLALRALGTPKSIPVLKKMTSYQMADVKVCSVLAIGAIAGPNETDYYADLLDSAFRDKTYVMSVIWEVGDERALDAVTRLAKKVLTHKVKPGYRHELLYITEYLDRFDTPDANALSAKLQELDVQELRRPKR